MSSPLSTLEATEAHGAVPQLVARRIIAAALSAPSGDNCQPWRFALCDNGFDVHFQPERATSLLDPDNLASRMALGALLEAARLRATQLGFQAHWHLDPDPGDPLSWARVVVTPNTCAVDPLAEVLFERETNRQPFDGSLLLAYEQQALSVETAEHRVRLLRTRPSIRAVARLARGGEYVRSQSRRAHLELHHWLRWSPAAAIATRDGLDVRTLGLNVAQRGALKLTAAWRLRRFALGIASATAAYAGSLVDGASGVGLITLTANADPVSAGVAIERVWLRATQLGLAFSPMAALPLLCARLEREPETFTRKQRQTLRQLGTALAAQFRLEASERPVFLFRVGRAERMPIRALRLDVSQVIINETTH